MQWGITGDVISSETTSVQLISMSQMMAGSCTVLGERENTGSIISFTPSTGILILRNTYCGEKRGRGKLYFMVIGF